ncbi:MAG: magnesium/cobalt transporter CorA [Pirellulales bacterium]|nr:magnesium/cobalt transporter CorA [Pirellulales bacterium]
MSNKHNHKRRHRPHFRRRTPPGTPPGTLAPDPHAIQPTIQVFAYGPDDCVEKQLDNVDQVRDYLGRFPFVWLNIDGLADSRVVAAAGKIFNLHPLALEDVLHVHQRSKVEPYADHLFIVARMLHGLASTDTEQLSLFLGRNFVVTFQEIPGDCLDPVRERLRKAGSRVRTSGPDYLAYSILDTVIDAFFPLLESFGEQLDGLEEQVVITPDNRLIAQIHQIKRELVLLRRAIWPQREAINTLIRDPSELVKDDTRLYLRDCYDHTVQIIDLVEVYRDIASGLTDLYVSGISNRMNEVMKVLTIIATIFIPLSFVAGVYGMNFDTDVSPWNMPELEWYFGYPFAWGVMLAMTLAMLFFFWRKGWLRSLMPTSNGRVQRRVDK